MNAVRHSLIAALSAAVLPLAGCSGKPAAPAAPPVVSGLTVATAQLQQVPDTTDAVGTIRASESATLAAQMMGRVTAVAVKEGNTVHAGQVLVTLDGSQARAAAAGSAASITASEHQLQIAQSNAALAISTLRRYQILRERKSVSPQEFDEVSRRAQAAAAQVQAAQAQVAAAKAAATGTNTAVGYARIRAPFNGVVTAREVDPGAMATPGMPLLQVEKSGTLQLNATVDESQLQALQKGMAVGVKIASLSPQLLQGRVAEIDPAADPSSHSFLVKINLPAAPGLRSGMYGTAKVAHGRRSALLVPQMAVVTHGSLHSLWVLDANHIASLRYVTLGAAQDGEVEVLSGLSPGEQVVLSASDRELGGSRIEVQ